MRPLPLLMRKATERDLQFLRTAWIHSSCNPRRSPTTELVRVVDSLMPFTFVAHLQDDPDTLVGFICGTASPVPTVIFAYVKHVFRDQGVAKFMFQTLFADDPDKIQWQYTTLTKVGICLADKYKATYNPYFLMNRKLSRS